MDHTALDRRKIPSTYFPWDKNSRIPDVRLKLSRRSLDFTDYKMHMIKQSTKMEQKIPCRIECNKPVQHSFYSKERWYKSLWSKTSTWQQRKKYRRHKFTNLNCPIFVNKKIWRFQVPMYYRRWTAVQIIHALSLSTAHKFPVSLPFLYFAKTLSSQQHVAWELHKENYQNWCL